MFAHLTKLAVGLGLGIVLSMALLPIIYPTVSTASSVGPIAVPDNQGEIERIELHYTAGAGDLLLPAYIDLFSSLADEIEIWIVAESMTHFDDLRTRLDSAGVTRTLKPVITDFSVTPWSRDRYTLSMDIDGNYYMVVPERSDGASQRRLNDWMVPWELAEFDPTLQVMAIPLRFDGGDLMVTQTHVIASARLLEKNLGTLVRSRQELVDALQHYFGREVFLFGEGPEQVPYHHVGMFITPMPDGSFVLADPDLAIELFGRQRALELGADLSEENLNRFRAVHRLFREAGFATTSMPMLPLEGELNYITYNNLLMDVRRSGETHVFVPTYNIPELDAWALAEFQRLGAVAHGIDVEAIFVHNGSVRCLVNILARI